jgi:hypothetical protein
VALDPDGLRDDLESLFADPPWILSGDEVDVTATRAACAQAWADAMESYASQIAVGPVSPASTTVVAAAAALSTALAAAFALPDATSALEMAFDAFATTVGGGMAPAFTATPPPAPVGFAGQLATMQSSHAEAASAWRTLIDTWMRTGTATPSGGGAPASWS